MSGLEAATHAMSEALYKAAAGGGAPGAEQTAGGDGAPGQGADDDAIDAEFEVKS